MLQLDLFEFRRLINSLDEWVKVCVLPTRPVADMRYTSYKCMTRKWRLIYEKNKYYALVYLILYKYSMLKIKTPTETLCGNRITFFVDVYFNRKSNKDSLTSGCRRRWNVDLIRMGL